MKKLIVAAFAVAYAAFTQAASVAWGGAISSPDDTEVALSAGQVAVLLYSETAMSALTTIDSLDVGTIADNGGTIVHSHVITESEANDDWAFGAVWGRGSDKDVNGFYAILIGNDEGTFASYMDMGQITGTIATSSPTSLDLNSAWDTDEHLTSGGYTISVGGGPGPEPVPEPTSGLLLLLGMAGLALKRKCA